MSDGKNNLIKMSPRLNESTPNFKTLREILCIASRPRSKLEQRTGNGPVYHKILRQKPGKNFVLKTLYAAKLDFTLLT